MTIRILTLLGAACMVGGLALALTGAAVIIGAILIAVGVLIQAFLALRATAYKIRDTARDARAFATGNVQHIRLAELSEPKGWIWPKSTAVIELEGADKKTHRFEREIHVAWPYAWGYRLSKRFKLPLVSRMDLTKALAFELRREGAAVEVGRPTATSESPEASAIETPPA